MRYAPSLLIALYLTSHTTHAEVEHSPPIRVLHWNVLHSGSGTDGVLDRARQVAWLVRQRPDLVTLNEVTDSAAADYLARLRLASGHEWFLHHVAAVRGSDGNAILSRYPMLAKSGRVLTRARSIAHATVDVDGTPVNVFSTHIESGNHRASRAEQVQRILPYLAEFAPPRIVNGDLNAGPDAEEIQPLLGHHVDAWEQAVRLNAAVSYGDNPPSRYTRTRGARIDYILTSDDRTLHVTGCELPDQRDLTNPNVTKLVGTSDDRGVRPSDHNLISCTLDWRTKRTLTQPDAPPPPPPPITPLPAEAPVAADPSGNSTEIVLWVSEATVVQGWSRVADASAAGSARLSTSNAGVAVTAPLVAPSSYFDVSFQAEAGRPYRLWIRGLAEHSHSFNDSVYVQFSHSVTAAGEPIYRIGTASATAVILEEFLHAGLSKWGWADNGWDSFGPEIYFAMAGPQTLRVQVRQDGVSIDQIVLSSGDYLWTSPGLTKDDQTILPRAIP